MGDDEEMSRGSTSELPNATVHSFGWKDVTVTVEDRRSKQQKPILSCVNGRVQAGELLALMGPSGSGKSTLLNMLAQRVPPPKSTTQGSVYINGSTVTTTTFRRISAYVEQEDALVGSLTVRETLEFAARLSLPPSTDKAERAKRIELLLTAFGLLDQADTLIGTPIRKGVSGGQKRRVSVASQLITSPKILFLDEPTSGLDSAAAFEVVSFLKEMARKYRLIVIASMHQPSTSTFAMCDKLLLLSRGSIAYSGRVDGVQDYFDKCGYPIPMYMNPAEFALDFVNTDFARDELEIRQQLDLVQCSWDKSGGSIAVEEELVQDMARSTMDDHIASDETIEWRKRMIAVPLTLIHRSFIKSYRDIVAYGIRSAMYLGLAVMMGTIWLRLEPVQANIQSFINAIFFGGAFMSFMAVAYIPAFLEDHSIFMRERANGLYGAAAFVVANFIVGIPYLFVFSLLFSLMVYWLSNFRSNAGAFFTWTVWLFLDLLAAESLVVLVSSVVPIFVVALAGTAFANGLWMCAGGFLVPPHTLNAFWRYLFHYVDYQSYVFQGMMINEFGHRNYSCALTAAGSCDCMYKSDLAEQCLIDGRAVLDSYGISTGTAGRSVGIMITIIVGYRALGWLVLHWRSR